MSYQYADRRSFVFTEEGQTMLIRVMKRARACIEQSGAVRCDKLIGAAGSGDTWNMLAVVDRLVEMELLHEITTDLPVAGQHRVFVAGKESL